MSMILASGSPRRRELLSMITPDFRVEVSDFDESVLTAPTPKQTAENLAFGKCMAVAGRFPGEVVIGCDTVVEYKGKVFGKPHTTSTPASACGQTAPPTPSPPPPGCGSSP